MTKHNPIKMYIMDALSSPLWPAPIAAGVHVQPNKTPPGIPEWMLWRVMQTRPAGHKEEVDGEGYKRVAGGYVWRTSTGRVRQHDKTFAAFRSRRSGKRASLGIV